ncbi:MAG: protein kinase [Acidobacteriota bacterium]
MNLGNASPKWVGAYRIDEQIGSGGMGEVYRGFHERLSRSVALKRVRPDLERNAAHRARLLFEARTAAMISHPNVVQIYDILELDDADWIVMELAEGEVLSRRLAEGSMDIKDALSVATDVAKGLAAAHARGIIHRDLKTDNVVLSPDGRAKILDFGIAKRLRPFGVDGTGSQPSEVLGTPHTMSPEQALESGVDPRSDLFSLGILLYEALTGKSPFRGRGGLIHTLRRICFEKHQPVRVFNPAVPANVSRLIDRLLAKTPSARPQTADEVIIDLQRLRGEREAPAKVLFVDYEPDFERLIRLHYRAAVSSGDLDLVFARDGREALEVLEEDSEIPLVITDLNMPRMGGLALLGEIRELDRPVLTVVVSAFGDMSNIRTAMNLGAFDFLIKPIDLDDLERTLRKALREARRHRQLQWLREENRLLDERHQFLRDAFSRRVSRDPSMQPTPSGAGIDANPDDELTTTQPWHRPKSSLASD